MGTGAADGNRPALPVGEIVADEGEAFAPGISGAIAPEPVSADT